MISQPQLRNTQRNRHTKPCKFFQTNECSLTAEVCDFAHVKVAPGPLQIGKPCRYFVAGHCSNGQECRYSHVDVGPEFSPIERPSASGVASPIYGSLPFGSYLPYYHGWAPAYPPNIVMPMPIYPSHISPTKSSDSTIASSLTSKSSSESDDALVVTEDPQFSEHSHKHQSRIQVYEDMPIVHIPPLCSLVGINPCMAEPLNGHPERNRSRSRVRSRAAQRQKAAKFKTKPCKFYVTEKGCPNGSDCTFIHDGLEPEALPQPEVPEKEEKDAKHTLPPKPLTQREQSMKQGYFPVSWRVIGGGVLVGGQKKSSDKNSRDDEHVSEGDSLEEEDGPGMSDSLSQESVSFLVSQDPPQAHRRPPPMNLKRTRARSNSIPSTPSTTHVNMDALFSAESPGGL